MGSVSGEGIPALSLPVPLGSTILELLAVQPFIPVTLIALPGSNANGLQQAELTFSTQMSQAHQVPLQSTACRAELLHNRKPQACDAKGTDRCLCSWCEAPQAAQHSMPTSAAHSSQRVSVERGSGQVPGITWNLTRYRVTYAPLRLCFLCSATNAWTVCACILLWLYCCSCLSDSWYTTLQHSETISGSSPLGGMDRVKGGRHSTMAYA